MGRDGRRDSYPPKDPVPPLNGVVTSRKAAPTEVQTKGGAAAEHRRLLVELAQTGTLRQAGDAAEGEPEVYTFEDAVRHFRATHLKNGLKPSTRAGYENRIDVLLVPRFGSMPLAQIDGNALTKLDVELVADQLAPSTRAKIQTVLRSVLRASVRGITTPRALSPFLKPRSQVRFLPGAPLNWR